MYFDSSFLFSAYLQYFSLLTNIFTLSSFKFCSVYSLLSVVYNVDLCIRYGEKEIMIDERLPAVELLNVESDLLDNNMYILVTLLTHLEMQKSESVSETIAARNVFE